MENKKLTKLEEYWIMYDVGNSAFVMLIATIIPIYFNYLAKVCRNIGSQLSGILDMRHPYLL